MCDDFFQLRCNLRTKFLFICIFRSVPYSFAIGSALDNIRNSGRIYRFLIGLLCLFSLLVAQIVEILIFHLGGWQIGPFYFRVSPENSILFLSYSLSVCAILLHGIFYPLLACNNFRTDSYLLG